MVICGNDRCMPFQKGHTLNVGSHGQSAHDRRARMSLASVIRERVDPHDIVTWLECIRDGFDPADPRRDVATVDLKTRIKAQRILLERGWGQPTQALVIEGLIRSEQITDDGPHRPHRTIEQINARRVKLLADLDPAPDEFIEAVARERK